LEDSFISIFPESRPIPLVNAARSVLIFSVIETRASEPGKVGFVNMVRKHLLGLAHSAKIESNKKNHIIVISE